MNMHSDELVRLYAPEECLSPKAPQHFANTNLLLVILQCKTLLEEKMVITDVVESYPRITLHNSLGQFSALGQSAETRVPEIK